MKSAVEINQKFASVTYIIFIGILMFGIWETNVYERFFHTPIFAAAAILYGIAIWADRTYNIDIEIPILKLAIGFNGLCFVAAVYHLLKPTTYHATAYLFIIVILKAIWLLQRLECLKSLKSASAEVEKMRKANEFAKKEVNDE
jgi:hypothetical protein